MTLKEARDLCNRLRYCSKMLERTATVETLIEDNFRELYEASEVIDDAIILISALLDRLTVA